MVESNKPINATNNDQVWDGMAIGAGAGAGIAGMALGGAYGKHRFNESRRNKLLDRHREEFQSHMKAAAGTPNKYFDSLDPKTYGILHENTFKASQAKTIHSKMGGGWKRAGIVAGLSALGAGVGTGVDYFKD